METKIRHRGGRECQEEQNWGKEKKEVLLAGGGGGGRGFGLFKVHVGRKERKILSVGEQGIL